MSETTGSHGIVAAEYEIDRLQKCCAEYRAQLAAVKAEVRQTADLLAGASGENDALRAQLADMTEERDKNETRYLHALDERDAEHAALARSVDQLAAAQAEVEKWKGQFATATTGAGTLNEWQILRARVRELESRQAELVRALERIALDRATIGYVNHEKCMWCGMPLYLEPTVNHEPSCPTAIAIEALK